MESNVVYITDFKNKKNDSQTCNERKFKIPRRKNERDYIRPEEYTALIKAAKSTGWYPERNATMIMLAYRHGLRVTELCTIKWSSIDFNMRTIFIERKKGSKSTTHLLQTDEIRLLRRIQKTSKGPYVFTSNRKDSEHMNRRTFYDIIDEIGKKAGLEESCNPHKLRHGCGFKLINDRVPLRDIQHHLGHINIQNTVEYTKYIPSHVSAIWKD